MEDKDGMGRVVLAVGVGVLAKKNIFVSVHNLDAPMLAVELKQVLWSGLNLRQAGDEINGFFVYRLPFAFLFALNEAAHTTNLLNRWPIILNACGLYGKNFDGALFNPPVRFFCAAVVALEGEKPAP